MAAAAAASPLRVLYICGLGSNAKGAKPEYLRQHFRDVSVPSVKHASYAATKEVLARAVSDFGPDVVVAHSAGVGKAVTLATSGAWAGPLVLLAGGNGCSPVADLLGRAVTVVVPEKDPDAAAQRRILRSAADKSMVVAVEVSDVHDLNKSMVEGDRLQHLIVETVQRHGGTVIPRPTSSSVVTTDARDQVRFLFSEWDLNGDGLISPEEFKSLFSQLCPEMPRDSWEALLQVVDRNQDGAVDLDEFIAWTFSGGEHTDKILAETTSLPPAGMSSVDESQPAQNTAAEDAKHAPDPAEQVVRPPCACSTDTGRDGEAGPSPLRKTTEETTAEEIVPAEGQAHAASQGAAASTTSLPEPSCGAARPVLPGQLFTWGRGSDGQLGQEAVLHPGVNCALPHPVRQLRSVVHVACGGGQQGCTAAVTSAGELFTFGNNFKGRLGHGEGPSVREPRRVEALAAESVLMAACGPDHSAALVRGGRVFLWGGNRHGQLGRGHADGGGAECAAPAEVTLPAAASQIDCEDQYSAAVLADGRLLAWGCNGHGRLGIGGSSGSTSCPRPAEVQLGGLSATSVSLGSLYAGAVGAGGELLMWGYGGHGNLGLGTRASFREPQLVDLGEPALQLACTRGQEGCKGGLNPKAGGNEGPHTVVVARSGALYTMGTCHKGLLCNLGNKDGAFGKPWDELRPYRVGGPLRNGMDKPPLSPLAVWPPPYDSIGPFASAVSAHIHCACVGADGRAWAWGCGSNDGRCGVERFLNMKGEGRPPEVDMMKCYMMGPHRIGLARPLYWKHPSLQNMRVAMLATGRNHMACIAVPQEVAEAGES